MNAGAKRSKRKSLNKSECEWASENIERMRYRRAF